MKISLFIGWSQTAVLLDFFFYLCNLECNFECSLTHLHKHSGSPCARILCEFINQTFHCHGGKGFSWFAILDCRFAPYFLQRPPRCSASVSYCLILLLLFIPNSITLILRYNAHKLFLFTSSVYVLSIMFRDRIEWTIYISQKRKPRFNFKSLKNRKTDHKTNNREW